MIFEVYKSKDSWRWRLLAKNGRIMADSGEAYQRPYNARRAIHQFLAKLGCRVGPPIKEKR